MAARRGGNCRPQPKVGQVQAVKRRTAVVAAGNMVLTCTPSKPARPRGTEGSERSEKATLRPTKTGKGAYDTRRWGIGDRVVGGKELKGLAQGSISGSEDGIPRPELL